MPKRRDKKYKSLSESKKNHIKKRREKRSHFVGGKLRPVSEIYARY